MGYRINERNSGHWSIDGEPKIRPIKQKKVTRSFSLEEIELYSYFLNQIVSNIELDASDLNNQVYRDNGNILIQFNRDKTDDLISLTKKFK